MKTKFGRNLPRGVPALCRNDRLLQFQVLLAAGAADALQQREVLPRLGEVADHQVGLAEVLVRAAVLRIDAQRLVAVLEDEVHLHAGRRVAGAALWNGYSLVRRILESVKPDFTVDVGGRPLADALIEPTRIYARPVLELLERVEVKGLAHITGGGLTGNAPLLFRLQPDVLH